VDLKTQETPSFVINAETEFQGAKNRGKEPNGNVEIVANSMNWMLSSVWVVEKR
jgi:hypothetical protein